MLVNGSDNALLSFFLDPALGCTPMTAPDLSNPGQTATSQALDELAAAANQAAPIALTPVNDPMTMDNGAFSIAKTNLYRAGVDQPPLPGSTGAVKDGWDDILVNQLDNRFRPCNLVELMPRLQEHLKAAE